MAFKTVVPFACLPMFLLLSIPAIAQNQELTLTLTDALRLAEGKSEQVDIARAGAERARAEQIRAHAQRMPQLNGALSYTRTLASEFANLFNTQNTPTCAPLAVNAAAPLADRIAEVERYLECGGPLSAGFGGGGNALPFGRTNIWNFGLTFAQPVYAGGRISAQNRAANAARAAADIQVDSSNAQFVLDVTQAFYDAALAYQFLQIAQANLDEATKNLDFVRLGNKVGRLPEFDVLRAEVTRRNLLPEIARRKAALAQAGMRLRQLLELPPNTPLRVSADLMSNTLPVPQPFEQKLKSAEPLRRADQRAPVREADAAVRQQQATLAAARGERWPSISIASDYGLVAYPQTLLPNALDQFRNNWTLGFSVQAPLFQGGRIRADIVSAEASVNEARAQRKLTRELAELDSSIAVDQLNTAEEQWNASSGTIDQATKAYDIARLRYHEGISSQLELDDARLALLQARADRAQAARDLQVARATVALLPLLPISLTTQTPGQAAPVTRAQPGAGLSQPTQTTNPFQTTPATQSPGTTTGISPSGASQANSAAGARTLP